MSIAATQPATQPAPAAPAAPVRDSREAFIPGDPLGARFSGDSIAGTAQQGDRLAALARTVSEPVAPEAEEHASEGAVTFSILLIVAGLSLLALYLYRRRGRFNFGGQDGNR